MSGCKEEAEWPLSLSIMNWDDMTINSYCISLGVCRKLVLGAIALAIIVLSVVGCTQRMATSPTPDLFHNNRSSDLSAEVGDTHRTVETSTIVIAASDSSPAAKVQADYICDGINDHIEIQTAVDNLLGNGGTVLLLKGTFYISNAVRISMPTGQINIIGNKSILTIGSSPVAALAEDVRRGEDVLKVTDSSLFEPGMGIWLRDTSGGHYENDTDIGTIAAIPNATTIQLEKQLKMNYTIADGAQIIGICRYIDVSKPTAGDFADIGSVTIKGIVFDGNESAVSVKGSWHIPMLYLAGVRGAVIEDNIFRNSNTTAITFNCSEGLVSNNVFENFKAMDSYNGFDTVHLASSRGRMSLISNTFDRIDSETCIFFCMAVDGAIIANNSIEATGNCKHVINIQSETDARNVISGNYVRGPYNGNCQFIRDMGTETHIIGNTIVGGSYGILNADFKGAVLLNCICDAYVGNYCLLHRCGLRGW
ncbi:NosD domain-containing protein [Chloroflexota bacterium]